jgi:hypothetical protein
VPTTTITIYEVSNSYVTNGSNTSISGVFQLTITDGDLTLQSSEGSDSGSSQVMTMDGSAVQRYRFYYDDTISINGGTETVKTFQLRINGVMRSFIMNDSGPTIPSATVGTTFNLLGYTNYTNVNYSQLLCFVRGTRILTSKGNRPVENLRIGDLVETKDHGMQPIRWAGKASLSIRDLIAQPHLRPVLIPASSFARNVPARDLYVSPQHRVMLSGWQVELNFGTDEVIAPAASMVGKNGIRIDVDRREVEYFHIMFDRHEMILSEGLATESFLAGATTISGMDKALLDEILELFPELASGAATKAIEPARTILQRFEVNTLKELAA